MKSSEPKQVGRKQRFNAQDVINAARHLGLDTFTMGEVAATIGVAAPAVYRIFAGRNDLLETTVRSAADQTPVIPAHSDSKEAVRFFTDAMWKTVHEYRGLSRVLETTPSLFLLFAPHLEALAKVLAESGFESHDDAALAATIYLHALLQLDMTLNWVTEAKQDDLPDAEQFPRLNNEVMRIRELSHEDVSARWNNIFTTIAASFGVEVSL